MKKQRQISILSGILLLVIFGGMSIGEFNIKCSATSQNECASLWILYFIAILGGILLSATYFKQQINQPQTEHIQLKGNHIWSSAIARVILSTIMLSLPIFFQGAYIAPLGGLVTGYSIILLYRGLANKWV